MSSVTHNRVYLSPDKPFLTFETLIPYMVDSTAGLNITFTPADISGGSPVTVFHQLPAGFFDRHQNVIEILAEMLGKTVTITTEAANDAGKLSDEVIAASGATEGDQANPDTGQDDKMVGQLYFIEDRKSTGQNSSHISENDMPSIE